MPTDYPDDAHASSSNPPSPLTPEQQLLRKVLKFLLKHNARFQFVKADKRCWVKAWQKSSTKSRTISEIERLVAEGKAWGIMLTDLVKEGGLCFFDTDDAEGWSQYHSWRSEGLIPNPFLIIETNKTFDINGKKERGFHAWHWLPVGHGITLPPKAKSLTIKGAAMEAAGYGNLEFFGWGRYGIGGLSTIDGYRRRILNFYPDATEPLPKKMCELLNEVQEKFGKNKGTKTGTRKRGRPRNETLTKKKPEGDRHNTMLKVIMHIYDPQWGLSDTTARKLIDHYDRMRNEMPLSEEEPEDVKNQIEGAKTIWAERTKLLDDSPIVTATKEHYPDIETKFYRLSGSPAAVLEARLEMCGYEVCFHLREGHAFARKKKEGVWQAVSSEFRSKLLDMVTAKTLPFPAITDTLQLKRNQPLKVQFGDELTALAYNKQYDPVLELFKEWWEETGGDGMTTAEDFAFWTEIAYLLFNYDNDEDMVIMGYGLKYLLLGLVWRAYVPGCEFNLMPIWCGGQGAGKSCLVSKLAIKKEWYRKGLPMKLLNNAERLAEQLSGAYLIEDQEARGVGNTDTPSEYRAFLDVTDVRCRGAYKDIPGSLQLRCGYVATSNTRHVLPFETREDGDRRLLCCWVKGKYGDQRRKNGEHICKVIDEKLKTMYRRALSLYHAEIKPWLTDEETDTVMEKNRAYGANIDPASPLLNSHP